MSDVSRNINVNSCTIVDAPKVIERLVVTVILFLFGIFLYVAGYHTGSYITIALSFLGFVEFSVNAKGYIIDVENDIFKFPGGGIEAESWISYFTPKYLLQGLMRHNVALSAIRHINAEQNEEVSEYTDSKGRLRTRTTKKNILEIDGDFGAIRFVFSSKGKMGQLHSAIVQINNMGDPILKR
jgi:hypothetical protein